jgi:hypothetical protein
LAAHRAFVDMHGDHALEYAVAELIDDGSCSVWAARGANTRSAG